MKKKFGSIIVAFIVAFSCFGSLIGCKKEITPNSSTDIQISMWKAGLGTEFMDNIIAAFKAKNPEYNILPPLYTNILTTVNSTMMLGEDDTVDIYFTTLLDTLYDDMYSDMSSVLNYKADGESKTIGERFNKSVLKLVERKDGKKYQIPFGGGIAGLCYNGDVINGVDYEVPLTSNDLDILATELAGNGKTPFIHFKPQGYWHYIYQVWQAQYDGADYFYNNFLNLTDENGVTNSKEVMLKKDGRERALTELGKILRPETIVTNSNTMAFDSAQTKFINNQGAMMANGMWMQNEMSASGGKEANVHMMRMPIISSIIEKLDTVKQESALKAVIKKVDEVIDGTSTVTLTGTDAAKIVVGSYNVSEKDYKRIYEARTMITSNSNEQVAIVPNYSVAKEGAMKFLQFFYSDEGQLHFYNQTHFASPIALDDPSKLDKSDWTEFEKECYNIYSKEYIAINSVSVQRSTIFSRGGAGTYANVNIVSPLCTQGEGRQSATQLWAKIEASINSNWKGWVDNAGI